MKRCDGCRRKLDALRFPIQKCKFCQRTFHIVRKRQTCFHEHVCVTPQERFAEAKRREAEVHERVFEKALFTGK